MEGGGPQGEQEMLVARARHKRPDKGLKLGTHNMHFEVICVCVVKSTCYNLESLPRCIRHGNTLVCPGVVDLSVEWRA